MKLSYTCYNTDILSQLYRRWLTNNIIPAQALIKNTHSTSPLISYGRHKTKQHINIFSTTNKTDVASNITTHTLNGIPIINLQRNIRGISNNKLMPPNPLPRDSPPLLQPDTNKHVTTTTDAFSNTESEKDNE